MTKRELTDALTAAKDEYRDALQLIWDNINQGQRKQLYKREEIKAISDRFEVEIE